jgi:glycosyltransferase involved in cell wall biosynthesis
MIKMTKKTIAFLFTEDVIIPRNLREYYISEVLKDRGFRVLWFYTSFMNYVFDYNFLVKKVFSRNIFRSFFGKYIIHPAYLLFIYLQHGIKIVWISGWSERRFRYLLWYILLLKLFRIKVVYDPIDPIYEYAIATHGSINYCRLKHIISILLYSLVDLVIALNDWQKQMLITNGVRGNKIHVGFYGANVDFFRTRKNQRLSAIDHFIFHDKFVIGWIGHMALFKGLEEIFIPLIMHLREEIPNVHFLLAGAGDKELIDKFVNIEKEGLYPLTVLGRIRYEELYGITSLLNLYIVPTKINDQYSKSIFPIKIFDAIACGVPVITTRTPLVEQIGEDFNSIYSVNFDYSSYKTEILNIYHNYDICKSKAMKSRENIEKYNNKILASSICDYIEKDILKCN